MKDKTGVLLKTGDLMAETTGGGRWDMKSFTSVNLWEVPGTRDGRGIKYTSEGKKTYFYWASAKEAYKLDETKLPDGFVFAFKHGLDSVYIEDCFMDEDIHSAIGNSDWKENALTPEVVETLADISEIQINSFYDVAEKWDLIFCTNIVPHRVVDQIMYLAGYKGAAPVNGEIGIAAMQDHFAFMSVYETLKDWKDKGVLHEKCKEVDAKRGC
jgi:hypothetical protein